MTREEAIKLIDTHTVCFYNEIDSPTLQALHMAIEALKAETSDRGEWIRWVVDIEDETGVSYIPHAKCSNCGTQQDSYTSQFLNFCPNCGAYMAKENKK